MPTLPNPFDSAVAHPATVDEAAAPSPVALAMDAAADRFVLDEEAFLNDIEPLPAFISAPSQGFLRAVEIVPLLRVLAGMRA
jgi:hypothetical protein